MGKTEQSTLKFSVPKNADAALLANTKVEDGQTVTRGDSDEPLEVGTPLQVGDVIVVPLSFEQVETEGETSAAEIEAILEKHEWNVAQLINEKLEANARSRAYQTQLARFKGSQLSKEDQFERMVRQAVLMGISEDIARKQIRALLASQG